MYRVGEMAVSDTVACILMITIPLTFVVVLLGLEHMDKKRSDNVGGNNK